MKLLNILVSLLISTTIVNGQTNTFPQSGYIGIGTSTPTYDAYIVNTNNTATTVAAVNSSPSYYSRFLLMNDKGVTSYGDLIQYSSLANTFVFGQDAKNKIMLYSDGVFSEGLVLGTITLKPLFFGTNNQERMRISAGGNVGIGTTNPTEKLSVDGKIRAREIRVENSNWPDYVFDESYSLPSLQDIKKFIHLNRHLPGLPSSSEVAKNGIELGEMNSLLLKKIEELTLHIIQISEELDRVRAEKKY